MTHVCHDVPWHIQICDLKHSWVLQTHTNLCAIIHWCMCEQWLIYMCAVTHSDVRPESSACVTRLIHMPDITHLHVWTVTDLYECCDSFRCAIWILNMCDTTHSYVWQHGQRRSDFKQWRLPNFPTSFHVSPRTYQTCFLGNPQKFKQEFTWVNGVPVTQKIYPKIG